MNIGLWLKRVVSLGLAIIVAVGLWALQPALAEPEAVELLPPVGGQSVESGVEISQDRSRITMAPAESAPRAGLVFYPGGLVDPRAYTKILFPVAQAGYLVVIVKVPFDLASIDIAAAQNPISDHPEVPFWVVGGHSLGGAAASEFSNANPDLAGRLALWAAYPINNISEVEGLDVLSISGGADGITTPLDIQRTASDLPKSTRFIEIPGAVHSYFGDYGEQEGDGTPTVTKQQAQEQIVGRTIRWLNARVRNATGS